MITSEPVLAVGVMEGREKVTGSLHGAFLDGTDNLHEGDLTITHDGRGWEITAGAHHVRMDGADVRFSPATPSSVFRLDDVTIGIHFHWERKEPQVFHGALHLHHIPGAGITAINEVPLEEYLKSVISSEMSATAPAALLQAHAITSRSWLVAMLERRSHDVIHPPGVIRGPEGSEIIRWYTREDHEGFDVCADDHCQRYHGVTKIISTAATEAIESTRGMFLVHDGNVCDARFYKACGGKTEEFPSAWEDTDIPYLQCIVDGPASPVPDLTTGRGMEHWLTHPPDAYCNTTDPEILRQVLPSFDQETTDFFRWRVRYEAKDLADLIARRSGMDLGRIRSLDPVRRGPSGRITALRIVGSRSTVTVGKELEIRRWLSDSHLYSSAFVVEAEPGADGYPSAFTLRGAGWGHGVGLCQIGAAVMATRGMTAETIVSHYFPNATLRRLY